MKWFHGKPKDLSKRNVRSLNPTVAVSPIQTSERMREKGRVIPLKSPKHTARHNRPTCPSETKQMIIVPHRQRNKPGEPEQSRYRIYGEVRDLHVAVRRQEARAKGEVGESGEDGPDGVEEHEVYLGGAVVHIVDDCGEMLVSLFCSMMRASEGRQLGRTPAIEAK